MRRWYTTGVLPYLTEGMPGIGGTLRAAPEDFVVDEEPAYLPSGAGDHVFVRIEKRGLTTPAAVEAIARALGVNPRDIGVAGMKDRHAVTRQWLSLPPPLAPEAALALAIPDVQILEAQRHPHKLRTGHVRANRFVLRVRGVGPEGLERAQAILDRLAAAPGAPNFYGEQRFGRHGDNAERGRAMLRGERMKDRRMARLMMSALQSELFNAWLAARLADGLYAQAIAGDLMHKRGGGMFDCVDPTVDSPRIGEIVPTGPMFGDRMRCPAAASPAAVREDQILAAAGLTLDAFGAVRAIAEGTRRDAAIEVGDPRVAWAAPETLEVAFTLPGGAYATIVLREIMKVAVDDAPPVA
ncbi:MAG TPA: tRNA pseudouridine(13) synthase TruD [Kofleriaceae bacterium]|jgi:tRNA pseudouridine13 synthase